jgi:chorismate mutase
MDAKYSKTEPAELTSIRNQIDELDTQMLDLMAARLELATATLDVKKQAGLLAVDVRREAAVVARGARLARERGLEPELVRDIFWRLLELSRAQHPSTASRQGR